jgi:titin
LLAAPSTLTAVPTSTGATLTFNQTTDATGYIVQRSTDNTLFSLVGNTLTGTSTSFVDSGLNPGTTYYYKLEAVDAAGTSAPATVSTLTTPNSPTLGGIATSTSQITLAWNPVFGATSYTLDMVVSGTATALASQPVGTATSLTISTGLSADSPYTYEIFASDASGASAASSTVTITTPLAAPTFTPTVSAGGVTLTFSAVADATSFLVQRSNDNVIFSPITNTLTGTSTAFVDSTALPGHSYYYSLTAIDAAGSSAAAVSNVLTLPDVPTLGAISTNGTSVFLSWNGVASATGYTLEMVVSGTATALSSQPIGAVTSFLVTGLTADSPYTYDIIATNSSGFSAESPTVNVTTLLAPPVITVAATTATSNTINWTSIPDATSYLLERSTNQAVWSVVTPAPAAGVATYVDNTNVVGGKTYYYRLSAIDAAGNSGPSNVASVLTYPTAPGVTAVVYSASEIDLTWTPSKSATAYIVNVETGTVWAANTTQPSGTATTLDLTGLTADTSYTYQVLAVNTTGTGAASNTVTPTTILAPPTGFSATEASDTSVTLAWTAVTDATNYIVQSSPDSNTWTTATGTSFTQSSNSYAVTGLTPGTVYYYRIASFNTLGQSVYTSPANATTPLNAPVGLTAAVNSASQISLTWTLDTDTGLTGYRLESSPDGNAWGTLAILGPISTSAIDTGLTTGTTYHFRLFALSTGGDSAADGPIVATTS